MKKAKGVAFDTDLTADDLKELVAEFKAAVKERTGSDFPDDPREQLWGAIGAVFGSPGTTTAPSPTAASTASPTTGARPSTCRRWCTATPATSRGTGVAFTRNPASGENVFYGEFLVNAQGEDVVAGVRTPRPVSRAQGGLARRLRRSSWRCARRSSASCATCRTSSSPSRRAASSCCRRATASAPASPPSASPSTWRRGPHRPDEALMRVEPEQLNQLLRPIFGAGGQAPRRRRRAGVHGQGPARRPRRRHRPASSSTPPTPRPGRRAASRSCSSATSPAPRTSAAWTPPRASSRRRAA